MKKVLRFALVGLGAAGFLAGSVATASASPVVAPEDAAAGPLTVSSTSSFLAYPQTGWRGNPVNINGCGLHTIRYNSSYRWYHNGQSGHLFNNSTGSGVPATRLSASGDASSPNPFGWKSILIVC